MEVFLKTGGGGKKFTFHKRHILSWEILLMENFQTALTTIFSDQISPGVEEEEERRVGVQSLQLTA